MSKVRRIRDFQHSFSFTSQQEQFGAFFDRFLESDLGKIYGAVPWEDMVTALGLKEAKKGPRAIFSPRGKVALMFLKHYSGCSDRKLVEGLNGNLDWQFFCGIYIGTDRLHNFKIVSEVRSELAGKLDIGDLQKALYGHWSPYVRPIVRGKEKKPVEFGAKVHKFQLDGIGFIEHLSFDAFHEGIRFRKTVLDIQGLTRTKVKIAGADAIYATNRNRRFASGNGIRTDFKRKGRAGKHEKQRKKLAGAITKERAGRLEGSFGNDKEHYGLRRIRARTKATETLWIFFGIHTANALEIGRRMAGEGLLKAA